MILKWLSLGSLPNSIVGFHIIAPFLNSTTFPNFKHLSLFRWCSWVVPNGEDNLACWIHALMLHCSSYHNSHMFPFSSQWVPINFSTCSQIPNVFPNVFSIAPHFYPICFAKCCLHFTYSIVACAVHPSVNPWQNRGTQHVNIVLQCMYRFFQQPNMKGNHAWIECKPSSVTTFSTKISFQNLVFCNLFEFSEAEIT